MLFNATFRVFNAQFVQDTAVDIPRVGCSTVKFNALQVNFIEIERCLYISFILVQIKINAERSK
jgi:hypothetical protein